MIEPTISEKNCNKTVAQLSAQSLLCVVYNFFTSIEYIYFSNKDKWKQVAFINIYFDLVCLFNDIYSLRNQAGTDIFYICAFSLMIFQLMCTTTPKILSMTDCTISLKTLIKNYLSQFLAKSFLCIVYNVFTRIN